MSFLYYCCFVAVFGLIYYSATVFRDNKIAGFSLLSIAALLGAVFVLSIGD